MSGHAMPADASPVETRQAVEFPAAMKAHTLANMRDHLLALQQIQTALSLNELDKATALPLGEVVLPRHEPCWTGGHGESFMFRVRFYIFP